MMFGKNDLIDLQIGSIQTRKKKGYSRFNFKLTNGTAKEVDCCYWDLSTVDLLPGIISKIQYCVQLKDGFLLGVSMLDENSEILAHVGHFHNVDKKHF